MDVPVVSPSAHPAELAGDASPLARALGGADALTTLSSLADLIATTGPTSPDSARTFLLQYQQRLLGPVELPAIRDAYHHARLGELRELIDQDRQLAPAFGTTAFASASRRAGRLQLRRLRPMRDTMVQRYLRAVDTGQAHGWHVIVYGILLARFAFPLRQSLAHYANATQHQLVASAALNLRLSPASEDVLRSDCDLATRTLVAGCLPASGPFG